MSQFARAFLSFGFDFFTLKAEVMVLSITAVVGTLVSVLALVFGVYQYRRTVHMNIFRTYADKYNKIIPPEKYEQWQAAIHGKQDHWKDMEMQMVEYLNLIWEEFYLSKTGVIPRPLWKLWIPEIKNILSSEFAKNVMEKYHFHFPKDLTYPKK